MLTNITLTAQAQANLVVQAKAGLLKVASASSGVLGTVKAEGVAAGTVVTWSLVGNPGAAITISAQAGDPTQATLSFSNVPVQVDPYLLIIQASTQDGKSAQIPLAVVVREAFVLKELNHLQATGGVDIAGHTYDAGLARLTFKGYGPIGEVPGVKFIPPVGLPTDLLFSVDGNDTAYLRPAPATLEDPSGGVKVAPGTYTATIRAYREGTLYDTPDTPATLQVTYDLTAGPLAGTLSFEVAAAYDPVTHGVALDASVAFPGGQAQVYTMEWQVSQGATGAWATTPTTNTLSALWKPSGSAAQDVTFTVNVKDVGGTVIATSVVGPMKLSGKDPAAGDNWTTTDAVPVIIAPVRTYPVAAGRKVYFRVTLPDLTSGESATVTITPVAKGAAVAIADPPATATLTGAGSNYAIVGFTVPDTSAPYDTWTVAVAAVVTGGVASRQGQAKLLVISSGAPALVTQLADASLTGNTGSFINPVTVRAYQWVQNPLPGTPDDAFLNPTPGVWNSTLTEVQGVTFEVSSAPAGITPAFQVGAGLYQLTGLVESAGTTDFRVFSAKSGFRTSAPAAASLLGQQSVSRIRFTDFGSTNPVVAGGQAFTLTWGYDGSGVLTLQKGNTLPPDSVTGQLSAAMPPITTPTVYILRGSNNLGEAFSAPLLVQLGATGSSTQLPPSPTIAVINDANHLTVAWQPSVINGSFTAYDHWVLSVKDAPTGTSYALARPGVTLNPTWVDGLGFGGTQDARRFEFDLAAIGYHELSMQAFADANQSTVLNSKPWDTYKPFPAVRSVTLDKTTASKGEAIAISVGNATAGTGVPGDRWQAVYSDGTTSDWFPMTITSVAKAFTQGGTSQTIQVVVEADYSTAFPPVKLRRTTTQTVFVLDQDFQDATDIFDIGSATVGLGGEAGYEVTNNLDNSKAPQPYLVAVPALVRDNLTHELKLLVATARGRDASSMLGTMAVDVFPLPGRPHTLELVQVPDGLIVPGEVVYDPVTITQDALPDVTVGRNMTPVRLQASGGKRPYRWFAAELPFGLTLALDGTLTGTVLRLGRFAINVSVQDSQEPSSLANKTLYLSAKSDLSIKTTTVPPAQVGGAYQAQLEAQQGVQPYIWDLMAGELPTGVTLGLDGVLSGWPVSYSVDDTATPYTFVAQVTDAVGAKASKQFQLALTPMSLSLREPDQDVLVPGMSYLLRFPIVGGKPGYTLQGQPTAPAGFIATANIVNGAVEILTSDSFATASPSLNVGITVQDAAGTTTTREFTLQLAQALAVTRWAAPSIPARISTASTPVAVAVAGTVSGMAYDRVDTLPVPTLLTAVTDVAQGTVTLTPPVTQGSNEESTFRVTIKQGATILGKITRSYAILTLAGSTTKDWTVKAPAYRQGQFFVLDPHAPAVNAVSTPKASDTTMRLKAGSTLPVGVSLDPVTAHLYGALQAATVPSRSVLELVDATDTVRSTVAIDWTLVGTSIQVTGNLTAVDVGQTYNAILPVIGAGASPTVELVSGHMPEGLTLAYDANNSTVTVTGRPMETGYFDLAFRVRDAANRSGLFTDRLVVNYRPYLAIPATVVPKITTGFSYSYKLQATGGLAPYTWALGQGSSLPDNIQLDADGTLHGTCGLGSYSQNATFQVTDAYGQTASASLLIAVGPSEPLAVTTTTLPAGVTGAPYIGAQLQATGGVAPYNWQQVTLPAGLSLDSATGIISGTPTAAFDANITFTVKDAMNTSATKVIKLVISTPTGFRITTSSLPTGKVGQALGGTISGGTTPSFRNAAIPTDNRVGAGMVKVKLRGRTHYLMLGGFNGQFNRTQSPSWSLGSVPANTPGPLMVFDPDTVVNGQKVGSWKPLDDYGYMQTYTSTTAPPGPATLKNRAFSAAVQISDTRFALIGGCVTDPTGMLESRNITIPNPAGVQEMPIRPNMGRSIQSYDFADGTWMTPVVFVEVSEAQSSGAGTWNGTRPVLTVTPVPQGAVGSGYDNGFHGAAACLLKDGRIFVVGGVRLGSNFEGDPGSAQPDGSYPVSGGETYLGSQGREAGILTTPWAGQFFSWTAVQPIPQGVLCAQAITLNDGRVLVMGGWQIGPNAGVAGDALAVGAQATNLTWIYNPTTNTWAAGPTMPTREFAHSAVKLSDGRVVYGGRLSSTENHAFYILDANATSWTTMLAPQTYAPNGWGCAVVMDDGAILYTGGTTNPQILNNPVFVGTRNPVGGTNLFTNMLEGPDDHEAVARLWHHIFGLGYNKLWVSAANPNEAGTTLVNPGTAGIPGGGGTATGVQLAATGGLAPYMGWDMTPAVPGLTFNASTGVLSGTPTDPYDGMLTFSVNDSTAQAAGGPLVASKALRLVVQDPNAPSWVTTSIPTGFLEENYQTQLVAKDATGTVLTGNYSVSPASAFGLPPGITLSQAGVLSGRTSIGWSRNVTFRVTHPNDPTRTDDQTILVEFVCNTNILTSSVPTATIGAFYSTTLQSSGGAGPYTWALASGNLPAGLSLAPSTGVISGTCTEAAATTRTATLSVTDKNGCTDTATLNFSVRTVAMSISLNPTNATKGQPYSGQLSCTGGTAPYTWTINSGLPLNFSYNQSTGLISASNVGLDPGSYPLSVTVRDSSGATTTDVFALTVAAPGYVWKTGLQHNNPGYTDPAIGIVWARNPQSKLGGSGSPGGAWAITVSSATRMTDPKLTVTGPAGTAWVAVRGELGGPGNTWGWGIYLNVAASNAASYPTGSFNLTAHLVDGGYSEDHTIPVSFEPTTGPRFPLGERAMDANGTSPSTSYSDHRSYNLP